MKKKCTFSGHRPKYFPWESEADERCLKLKNALKREIGQAIADGFDYFITGGAQGVDTWAAEIVLEYKKKKDYIVLEIAKPFATYNWQVTGEEGRRMRAIEAEADKVTIISDGADEYTDLFLRDSYMIDVSKRLIAVYDDDENTGGSGTKDTLAYAKATEIQIRQIQWQHL